MLLNLSAWWQSMELFHKIFWVIALLFSLLFLLQTVFSFADTDVDAAGDSDHAIGHDEGVDYQFFTIKNLIAFFTIFGWVGIAAYSGGMSKIFTIGIAVIGGLLMIAIMALLFRNVGKLKHSGTLELNNAINKVGNTYLFIPGKRSGLGKVHVQVQGALKELPAMTDDDDDIATGKIIKVLAIIDNRILLVSKV
ncbi:MAG: hypothetical protein QM731_16550 [Chitinophagaceae bacterium]